MILEHHNVVIKSMTAKRKRFNGDSRKETDRIFSSFGVACFADATYCG